MNIIHRRRPYLVSRRSDELDRHIRGVGAIISEQNAQRLSLGILVTAGAVGTLMVINKQILAGVMTMGAGLLMGAVVEGAGNKA